MQTNKSTTPILLLSAITAGFALAVTSRAADTAAAAAPSKPAWVSELSFSVKETYDDNVMGVAGLGMPEQSSWVNALAVKVGLDFVPLLEGKGKGAVKTFTFAYQPERFTFQHLSEEDYTAHRLNAVLKGKSGALSFSFDNAFLYIDGNKVAPFYALNQLSGPAANQFDKFRNNYAHSLARERRAQSQDRYNASVQYNSGDYFVRGVSSMVDFSLDTELHNNGVAPYKGYQNYADRYDVNGGVDFGYKLTPDLAYTLGYRVGYQYQQLYAASVTGDRHFSTNHYQRFLVRLEGKLSKTVTAKIAAGLDAKDYNPNTPINHLSTTRFYGEAAVTAALPNNQSLAFNYKQWVFVASTGTVPYIDTTCTLAYHWNVTKQWGLDVAGKILEANYTMGNDLAGAAPSLRDDLDYGASVGLTYTVRPGLILSASYLYDEGKNGVDSLAAAYSPEFREFKHNQFAVGALFKF